MDLKWIAVICGVLGILVVGYFARYVLKQNPGTERIREIHIVFLPVGLRL